MVADIGIATTNQASNLHRNYFKGGCDALVGIIAGAELDEPLPLDMPMKVMTYFRSIGNGLRPGDSIEISTELLTTPIRLTKESYLLQGHRTVRSSGTVLLSALGQVTSVDHLIMAFKMLLPDGRTATAPLDIENRGVVLEAFSGYEWGMRLRVGGIGRVRRNEPQLTFETVSRVDILEPLDTEGQLNQLRALEDGWLEGEGEAPSNEGLDWLSQAFARFYPAYLPAPYIYPTEDGGVQIEWSFGVIDINVRIDLSTQRAVYFWLDEHTESEGELDLADSADWDRLASVIRSHAER